MEIFEKAYNYAVYLLSLKLRTEGELRERMRLKKHNAKVVDDVIQKLFENNYLDDQRYAEVYMENLKKYKNFGYYGIKKKLMEKKLPSQIIEQVLKDSLSIDEEIEIAQRFLKRDPLADIQKKAQRLRSRGFRSEVISKLI